MRRRKGEDPSLFYIHVHPKHFSTARTVDRPTIDMVRSKKRGKNRDPDRVRLMFPRAMEVIAGTFKVDQEPIHIPTGIDPWPMVLGEARYYLFAKVRVGRRIFKITLEDDDGR